MSWVSTASLPILETQRCLNCDVQTVFNGALCIECDACVDICPMDCITFTATGPEDDLRGRLQAPAVNRDQALYVSNASQNRQNHGEGRGRLPALRPMRGALPDRRLGHAEIPPGDGAGRARMPRPLESTNDFVVKFANVNGSRLGQC